MILTLERARELLPPEYARMSDAEIEELLTSLEALADIVLDVYIEQQRKKASGSVSPAKRAA